MYAKGAGKGGNHSWVSSAESIGSLSYLVVQLYEHVNQRTFQSTHRQYRSMALSRIAHIPSNSFLVAVPTDSVKIAGDCVIVTQETLTEFKELVAEKEGIVKAVTSLNTVHRKGQKNCNVLTMEEVDDVEH